MRPSIQRLSICATLLLSVRALAQDKLTTSPSPIQSPPPTASAGLVNDWLRQQSPFFNNWDFGGQFRIRFEAKEDGGVSAANDFRQSGVDNHNEYLLFREKLRIGYAPESWLGFSVEGRDSSSIGDERHPSPDADQLDLYQAFIRLGDPAQFPITAKIGRQELIYGDERLIGNADWNNVPRSFDAVKLRFETSDFWVDAFASQVVVPVPHEFNPHNEHDWFSGIYASTATLIPKQETQLYFLSRNANSQASTDVTGSLVRLPSPRDIYTLGARVKSLPGQWNGWDYLLEAAGQFGNYVDMRAGAPHSRLDHEAFAVVAQGGYTFTNAWYKPRIALDYSFASGDSDPHDGKHGTFENLFPTNHKLYGYMDFFCLQNMHDLHGIFQLKPASTVSLATEVHGFWLADTHDSFYGVNTVPRGGANPTGGAGYGVNPDYSNYVGSELDVDLTYTPKPWAILRAGYGHFFIGDYVKSSLASLGGATDANWFYVQATITF